MKFKKDKNYPFIIAEIGHNHQGNIKTAMQLIKEAKNAGADAVKLQKRDNKSLYTSKFYNSPYDNPNSYGDTYGEHREYLEFDAAQYKDLISFSKDLNIEFFSTPFDFKSLEFLEKLDLKMYKISSADLIHKPLQIEIARTGKHIMQSTGGGSMEDVVRAKENIMKINKNLSILHCTASYPCEIEDMNLNVISKFKKTFPDCTIGLSDHENGIDAGPIAYMLGARIFEKHFTLNRANKGTDHAFSLEPIGLTKFVRNLRRIQNFLGSDEKKMLKNEKKPLFKMRKSIVAKYNIEKGTILKVDHLEFKSPGEGLEPYRIDEVIGKKLIRNISKEDFILNQDLE